MSPDSLCPPIPIHDSGGNRYYVPLFNVPLLAETLTYSNNFFLPSRPAKIMNTLEVQV